MKFYFYFSNKYLRNIYFWKRFLFLFWFWLPITNTAWSLQIAGNAGCRRFFNFFAIDHLLTRWQQLPVTARAATVAGRNEWWNWWTCKWGWPVCLPRICCVHVCEFAIKKIRGTQMSSKIGRLRKQKKYKNIR